MRKVLLTSLVILLSSCFYSKEVKVSPERAEKVKEVATVAMSKLRGRLMKSFTSALGKGGFVGAVTFCSEKASEIEKEVNAELDGIKVTRVALKYRNPQHRPDSLDRKVLEFFEKRLKEGKLPPYYVTAVKKGGKVYYVYYQPIRVTSFCLNCHGDPAKMDRRVLEVIRKKYPQDRAIGFKAGDLRGACKVVIPEEKLKG